MQIYGLTITMPRQAMLSTAGIAFLASVVFIGFATPAAAKFRFLAPQQPVAMAPVAPAADGMLPQTSTQTGTVQGFADQVPLTVALRQVLPRGTSFRINNDVDTKTPVSWRGGGNWQQTLDAMLANAGLQASYTQGSVVVQRGAMVMDANDNFPNATAPVILTPPVNSPSDLPANHATGFAAPAYASNDSMAPLTVPAAPEVYAPPMIEPAPQPYVAPSSMGVAAMMPDSNATMGAVQAPQQTQTSAQPMQAMPVQSALGTLPEGTVGELPQQSVPGTELEGLPPIQSGVLNPLSPGPTDAQSSLAGTAAQTWDAHSGQSLHEVMLAWAERAGVELNWTSEYDYPIEASLSFNGSFEEATRTLLGGFVNASPQPIGRLHRNEQLGQQALIIETRGNQYDE